MCSRCRQLAWKAPGSLSCFLEIVKPPDVYMCDLIYLSSIKINIKNAANVFLDCYGAISSSETPTGAIYYSVSYHILKAVLLFFVLCS